jgi:hypothetical protein
MPCCTLSGLTREFNRVTQENECLQCEHDKAIQATDEAKNKNKRLKLETETTTLRPFQPLASTPFEWLSKVPVSEPDATLVMRRVLWGEKCES